MPNPPDLLTQLGLTHLVPGFLERRRAEIGTMRRLFGAPDWDELRRLGHSLKGAGANFGFPELGDIGSRIEQAGIARDVAEMSRALDDYDRSLGAAEIRFATTNLANN